MNTACTLFAMMLLMLTVGCQAAPAPDKATLRVSVIAEPKTGVVTGNTHVRSFDAPTSSSNSQFEKVDYAALDDIVVWLQPAHSPPAAASATLTIELAGPSESRVHAASVGDTVSFHNSLNSTINLYSVCDGNDFDLGSLTSGGSGEFKIKSEGLIEVLSDSSKEPVLQIYAAYSKWVRVAHAGETIEFQNLLPGDYQIISWHPRLPGQTHSVSLYANHVTDANVKVGVNGLPKIN